MNGRTSEAFDLALVVSDLGSGGAQRVVLHLVEAWHKAGRRVAVITLADSGRDFFRLPRGVRRIAIGGIANSPNVLAGLLANSRRVVRLRRALHQTGAPVAVAFVAQTAVLTGFAAIGLPVRVVAAERNDPKRQDLGPIWTRLRRLAYRRADLVTANSRGAVDALANFVPRTRLAFVPNPLPAPPKCNPALLDAPTILSIGRLKRQKGHDVLLRAFALFAARHPQWRLAIIGEGPEQARLRAMAGDLRIAAKVDWLGQQDEPYQFLQACQIFALASRHEGMPNALLEAMSCALPCIVSDSSPGLLELVRHGINGLVVPVEDADALACALARLATDRSFAEVLGEHARDTVKDHEPKAALKVWEEALGLPTQAPQA
jgi:glycosyltransferase involved in cell wall biosynthesis